MAETAAHARLAEATVPECRRCDRLAAHLNDVRLRHPDYHAAPVPSFGAERPRLLIVGLAPGMHGANATGRPFTGDFAGILLYRTLFEFGFASSPESRAADDGLILPECRITNAVRCLPPRNKPTTAEVDTCNDFLREELDRLEGGGVVVALGRIAHAAVLKAMKMKQARHAFAHGARHPLEGRRTMIDSYHCSRYNTQTRRLTADAFRDIFRRARGMLGPGADDDERR